MGCLSWIRWFKKNKKTKKPKKTGLYNSDLLIIENNLSVQKLPLWILIFYTEVLCNRHFVAFAVFTEERVLKIVSFWLFCRNLCTKPMQMSVKDSEKSILHGKGGWERESSGHCMKTWISVKGSALSCSVPRLRYGYRPFPRVFAIALIQDAQRNQTSHLIWLVFKNTDSQIYIQSFSQWLPSKNFHVLAFCLIKLRNKA